MKILITGASGFLGSALARSLINTGHQISVLVRQQSNLSRIIDLSQSLVVGRCCSDLEIAEFIASVSPNWVIHTACCYGRPGEDSVQMLDANIRFGAHILECLNRSGKPVTFVNTGTALASTVSSYALSKVQFANWGRMIASKSDGKLRFVNILLQHMYGPGDDDAKFITYVMRNCSRNERAIRLTAGEQVRDFIYIEDVISAYKCLITASEKLNQIEDIEIGIGSALSIREVVQMIHGITASRTELYFGALAYRENEAMRCIGNTQRMKALGWEPSFTLEMGLRKTFEMDVKR